MSPDLVIYDRKNPPEGMEREHKVPEGERYRFHSMAGKTRYLEAMHKEWRGWARKLGLHKKALYPSQCEGDSELREAWTAFHAQQGGDWDTRPARNLRSAWMGHMKDHWDEWNPEMSEVERAWVIGRFQTVSSFPLIS